MAGEEKQDDKESSRSKLRSEAEKKVARSAGESAPLKKQALDKLVHELRVHQVELEMQNEELRGAQEQIAKSRNDYADLYDFSPEGYLSFDGDALITGLNLTGAALLGVERRKLLKRRFKQFVAPADAELWDRHFVSVLQQGEKQSCDLLLRRNDGSTLHARLDSIRVETDDGTFEVRTGISDITIQKQAEETLRHEEALLQATGSMAKVGGWELDLSTNQVTWTEEVGRIHGVEPEYQPKLEEALNFYAPESRPAVEAVLKKAAETGEPYDLESLFIPRGSKDKIWIRSLGKAVYSGDKVVKLIGTFQNIDKYKRAEESLQASEENYRGLVENINDVLYTLDTQGNITYMSPAVERFTSYKVNDIIGKPFLPLIHPDDLPGLSDSYDRLASGQLEPWEFRVLDKDGSTIFVRSSSRPIYKDGQITGYTSLMIDITERKKAEETIKRQLSEITFYYDNAPIGLAILDTDLRFLRINNMLSEINGIPAAEHIGKSVKEIVPSLESMVREVTSEIIKTGKAVTNIEFSGETEAQPGIKHTWLEGWYPLKDDDEKITGFTVIVQEITKRKQAEEKLLKSHENLKKTLKDAINTIVKIVETRDPYTAGHQQKVAELAVAIAMEMQFDDIQIDQLRTAAVIHDIGKMYVPSDILSKPGKLTDIEFSLIRTHAQAGFDIVKGMDFPGAVAETVLQHHERLDGSGYPHGLKGEDTLMKAKILAVADVVEAMASHRPYRPALGVDKALEEISKNRGKIYETEAVDACLRLFNSGRFEFKSV